MLVIPLVKTASQIMNVNLSGQSCTIKLQQRGGNVYCDLLVGTDPVFTSVICRDRVKLSRQPYLKFSGDFTFIDTQGREDPEYSGFGERYIFCYLEPDQS
ncbi:phage baseplate plug family protein [Serratia fonticola]